MDNMSAFSYCYEFTPDNPRRPDPQGYRVKWLFEHVGLLGREWEVTVPWQANESLYYHFKSEQVFAQFVLTWG
jgi:hypothetical protein